MNGGLPQECDFSHEVVRNTRRVFPHDKGEEPHLLVFIQGRVAAS